MQEDQFRELNETSVICIGDSIVEGEDDELGQGGWVGRIGRRMPNIERYRVRLYNLGIGGDTICDIHARLGEVAVRMPDVVILGCGTNDIFQNMNPAENRTPAPEYRIAKFMAEKSWPYVLDVLKGLTPRVLVLGIHPRDESFNDPSWGLITNADINSHNAYIKGLCAERHIAHHTFRFLGSEADLKKYYTDGTHFNAAGYDLYADEIYEKLKQLKYI